MGRNIITIDVGNTNTSIAVIDYQSKEIKWSQKYKDEDAKKATLCKDFLNLKDKFVPLAALVSSVVPDVDKRIKAALKEVDINAMFIKPTDYEDLLKLDVLGKFELGADIFCGCVESARRFRSSITIDMGTATTITLVKDSTLLACTIYPGVKAAFNDLCASTALLNYTDIKEPERFIGGNTVDALRSGMLYGTLGALKEIIARYKSYVKDAKLVFTGGASRHYIEYFDGCIYEKDLIHLGLAYIYFKKVVKAK